MRNNNQSETKIIPLAMSFVGSASRPANRIVFAHGHQSINWVRDELLDNTMFEKFDNALVLRCSDVDVCQDISRRDGREWLSRRFAYVFDVARKFADTRTVIKYSNRLHFQHISDADHGWERFSSLRCLAATLVDACTPVQLKVAVANKPLDVLKLSDFDFVCEQPDASQDRFDYGLGSAGDGSIRLCNGEDACVTHRDCPLNPVTSSRLCSYHHQMAAQCWNSLTAAKQTKLTATFERALL
jgi:hypothetical protein